MKRVREIDLEAPVREDDDAGEDEGGGGGGGEKSYAYSAWDEKYFSKKARWILPRQSDAASQRGPNKAGKRPGDPATLHDSGTNASPLQNPGIVELQARHAGPGIVQSQGHEQGMRTAKWRTAASADLQISMDSDFPESRPPQAEDQVKHELETFNNGVESERQSAGKGIEESAQGAEQAATKGHFVLGKNDKRAFPSSLAALLYSVDERQDVGLHSIFEKQGGLLSEADLIVRLEAVSFIGQHVQLIKESRTRKFVTEIVQQQLWKEEEPSVIQALVKVLCSVAQMSCADDGEDKNLEWASDVARFLFQYITAKDLGGSRLKSGLKLQLLRALSLIGKGGGSLEIEAVGRLAKEQLGSSNPRLREYGVRLLVQSIKERNVVCSRDLRETRAEYLENIQRSRTVGDSLMHTLLEYTRDPYPNVREAVVCAILNLHSKGFALKHNTYKFAVALLRDSFESVRICAIKLVGIWVKAAAWDVLEEPQFKYVDNAFLQICNMMTDMTMSVRQQACNVLAEMTGVSDSVLLQSLTKKILTTSVTERGSTAAGSSSTSNGDLEVANLDEIKLFDWSVAGAFVVGLEDEFWEVRSSAVKALAKLGISSRKMANGALELIVDMINDDSPHVRQQTIQALTNLALAGRLSVLEAHLHMFIGILEDSKVAIRKAGHDLLSVISLPSIATFNLTVRAILTSLDKHPEDEDSILVALEKLGRSHTEHTESMTNELVQELRGLLDEDSGLDNPRCVSLLVLILGAATGNGKIISLIPSRIISVASLMNNKLPISLPPLQVFPLGFKTNLYTWPTINAFCSSENHNEYQSRCSRRKWIQVNGSQHLLENEILESQCQDYASQVNTLKVIFNQEDTITPVAESEGSGWSSSIESRYQKDRLNQYGEREIRESTQRIVASALSTSLLLNMKAFKEVLQRLRGCRKELRALRGRCFGLSGTVSFCGLYLECLILVVELRASFVSQESRALVKMSGLPQDLLNKLNSLLKHVLHRFLGFSLEELLQILELHTIMYIWKLALHPVDHLVKGGIGSIPLLELESAVTTAEKITRNQDLPPSPLLKSVQEQLLNDEGKIKIVNIWKTARQLALSYWPSQISFDMPVREMWAVMSAPGSDFDHPLVFIPGLPLGIPIDVTVHNVPQMCSLWIQFVQDTSAPGYKLLGLEDSCMSSTSNICQLSTLLQLDEMPSLATSLCRLCIVMEGENHQRNYETGGRQKGPQGCIVPICTEMEVHLSRIRERSSKQLPHGKR